MWTLLLSTALAAEAPLQTEGEGQTFRVVDAHGRRVLPDDFAEDVGDDRTLDRYQASYRYAKTSAVTGWIGGPILVGSGGLFLLAGAFGGDAAMMLGGAAGVGLGAAVFAGGTAGYVVGRQRCNRMSTWYTLAEADALIDDAGLRATRGEDGEWLEFRSEPIQVVWSDHGVTAVRGRDELDAERFALSVGDIPTYRAARAVKWGVTGGGFVLCTAGYLTFMAAVEIGDTVPALILGTLGVAAGGTGVLSLTIGRRIYRDMDTWYELDEAKALVAGEVAASRPQPEVHAVISPFGVGLTGSF